MKLTFEVEGINIESIIYQMQCALQQMQTPLNLNPLLQTTPETRTEGKLEPDQKFEVVLSAHHDVGPGWIGTLRGDDGDEGYYLEFTGLFTHANSHDRSQETRTIWFEKKNVKPYKA